MGSRSAARGAVGVAGSFLLYVVAVFAAAPLLAVLLHGALTLAGNEAPALHQLTADLLKWTALIALLPWLRWHGRLSRRGFGLVCGGGVVHAVLVGTIIGLVSIAFPLLLSLLFELREWQPNLTMSLLLGAIWKSLLAGCLVALAEEIWLRGAVHGVLASVGRRFAIGFVAITYAALHFIRPDRIVAEPERWWDGYIALAGMFSRMGDVSNLDGFMALIGAGLVLGVLRERYGCIAGAVACHATWVFVIKLTRRTSTLDGDASNLWVVSHYDGIIGWGFCLGLVLLAAILWFRAQQPSNQSPDLT